MRVTHPLLDPFTHPPTSPAIPTVVVSPSSFPAAKQHPGRTYYYRQGNVDELMDACNRQVSGGRAGRGCAQEREEVTLFTAAGLHAGY
jgi:hypothetical protein